MPADTNYTLSAPKLPLISEMSLLALVDAPDFGKLLGHVDSIDSCLQRARALVDRENIERETSVHADDRSRAAAFATAKLLNLAKAYARKEDLTLTPGQENEIKDIEASQILLNTQMCIVKAEQKLNNWRGSDGKVIGYINQAHNAVKTGTVRLSSDWIERLDALKDGMFDIYYNHGAKLLEADAGRWIRNPESLALECFKEAVNLANNWEMSLLNTSTGSTGATYKRRLAAKLASGALKIGCSPAASSLEQTYCTATARGYILGPK